MQGEFSPYPLRLNDLRDRHVVSLEEPRQPLHGLVLQIGEALPDDLRVPLERPDRDVRLLRNRPVRQAVLTLPSLTVPSNQRHDRVAVRHGKRRPQVRSHLDQRTLPLSRRRDSRVSRPRRACRPRRHAAGIAEPHRIALRLQQMVVHSRDDHRALGPDFVTAEPVEVDRAR